MYLKILVSLVLVILIAWKFPVLEIIGSLSSVKISWFLLAFFLGELVILSQAVRWNYLLIEEQKPKFRVLLKYTVIGYFFNLFAPGGVGGDAYRSVAMGRAHNVLAGSVASVFVARIFGLFALCLLFWLTFSDDIPKEAAWFVAAVSLFLIGLSLFLVFNPFKKGKFATFAEKLREYKQYPLRLLLALFGSVFMQALVVFMQFAQFKAIGVDVPLTFVFAIVTGTALLTTIPVSFNGIGVREWGMLSLSATAINSEQILASLLLGYAIVILHAVQGAIFYIIPHDRNRI